MNEKRKQDGFTLIEISLVLVVIAAILFLGIERYLNQRKTAEIAQINTNLIYIRNALNQYYALNCKSNQAFTVSMSNLSSAGLLPSLPPSALLQTFSNGYQFDVSAQPIKQTSISQKPIYHFTISANLKTSIKDASYYAGVLNVSSYQGDYLTWMHAPSYAIQGLDRGLSIGGTSLQYFKEISTGANPQDLSCAY